MIRTLTTLAILIAANEALAVELRLLANAVGAWSS